jgi:DNA-binding GntR family transcriptional regulator
MHSKEAIEYFRHRERVERAAAKRAASNAARRVHQELAQQYAEKAGRS